MLRIGVILSGSGRFDGSEIHESVLTILALDRAGAQAIFFAPNKNQSEVINHLTGEVAQETRNILVESARIARGNIRDIREAKAADIDAVILPGGWGAVKNLSDFCWKGEQAWVDGEVYRLLQEMRAAGKPIGAICIAPAVLAKVFSSEKPKITIGTDKTTSEALRRSGAQPVRSEATEIVVDEKLNLITTPAYMLAERISEAADGIGRLVEAVVRRARARVQQTADSAAATLRFRKGRPADSAVARFPSRKTQPADSAVSRVARQRNRVSAVVRATRGRTTKSQSRRRAVRA